MQRCDEMNQTEHSVESSSSTKKYRVRAFLPNGDPPTCDCVAFAISRNRDGGKNHGGQGWCKHIDYVLQNTCQWQEDVGPETQGIQGVCPRCGGPTSDGEITYLPESPKEAVAKVTDSLQALMAELEGRSP